MTDLRNKFGLNRVFDFYHPLSLSTTRSYFESQHHQARGAIEKKAKNNRWCAAAAQPRVGLTHQGVEKSK